MAERHKGAKGGALHRGSARVEVLERVTALTVPGWEAMRAAFASGGPVMVAIALLSVIVIALIVWKIWRMLIGRAWARAGAEHALVLWQAGAATHALAVARKAKGPRARTVEAAFVAMAEMAPEDARSETARVARRQLDAARTGLRTFELIAVIAPLAIFDRPNARCSVPRGAGMSST